MWTFWKGVLFGNLRNKGIALFFAAVIWYFAFQNQLDERSVSATYELQVLQPTSEGTTWTIARTWTVASDETERPFDGKVSLVLTGPRKIVTAYSQRGSIRGVRTIAPEGIEPEDEEDIRTTVVRIGPEDFALPRWEALSIDPKRISPAEIHVELDRILTREIGIEAAPFAGRPHQHWQLDPTKGVVVHPPTVKVKGPARALAELAEKRVRTEAPGIGDGKVRASTFTVGVALAPLPGEFRGVLQYESLPETVQVTIPFREIAELKTFEGVPLKAVVPATMRTGDNEHYRLRCSVDRVSLSMKVTNEEFQQIEKAVKAGKAWVYFQVPEDAALGEDVRVGASEIRWMPPDLIPPNEKIDFAEGAKPVKPIEYRLIRVEEGGSRGP